MSLRYLRVASHWRPIDTPGAWASEVERRHLPAKEKPPPETPLAVAEAAGASIGLER